MACAATSGGFYDPVSVSCPGPPEKREYGWDADAGGGRVNRSARWGIAIAVVSAAVLAGAWAFRSPLARTVTRLIPPGAPITSTPPRWDTASAKGRRLALAAMSQVGVTVRYDATYVRLPYPMGDVAADRGVCTDVVVRAMRELGVDLQVAVHEDMTRAFGAYPHRWGLTAPDANIDHRRVPNLQAFFARKRKSLAVTSDPRDYLPGDIVTWRTGGLPHTGIVSSQLAPDGERYCIAHNMGAGTRVEDRLFEFEVSGHYRYW